MFINEVVHHALPFGYGETTQQGIKVVKNAEGEWENSECVAQLNQAADFYSIE